MSFYVRRLRRLLPALWTMIAIVSLLALVCLRPSDLPRQLLTAASAMVWLSNVHLSSERSDYFGEGGATNLFTHTWSLSVEEQFYLVWPIIILSILSFAARKEKALAAPLLALILAGLLICCLKSYADPISSFFLTPFRMWEFAVGALAYVSSGRWTERATVLSSIRTAALVGLIFCAILFNERTAHPGIVTLVPVALTTMILLATFPSEKTSFLDLGLLQHVGARSYSFYLWHWPLLVLAEALGVATTDTSRLAVIVGAYIVASLSFSCVESPTRRLSFNPNKAIFPLLGGIGVAIVTAAAIIKVQVRTEKALESQENTEYAQARSSLPQIYGDGCDDWFRSAVPRACVYGNQSTSDRVVFIGDSVGSQWFSAIEAAPLLVGRRLEVYTKSGCPILSMEIFYERIGRPYSECKQWIDLLFSEISSKPPLILIMGSSYHYDISSDQWAKETAALLGMVAHKIPKIVLIHSTPTLPASVAQCLEPLSPFARFILGHEGCSFPVAEVGAARVRDHINQAVSQYGTVSTVDLSSVVCPDGQCVPRLGGTFIYRDRYHITDDFVRNNMAIIQAALGLR